MNVQHDVMLFLDVSEIEAKLISNHLLVKLRALVNYDVS
jgi:hypothetical protein